MKAISKTLVAIALLFSASQYAQHHSAMIVEINPEKKLLTVQQELTYYNQSNDTLGTIVLNDWNNAYSSKNTPLARRFSDEFVRSFHLAKDEQRGSTNEVTIIDENKLFLDWNREDDRPDLIEVVLRKRILPNEKFKFYITYFIKVPSAEFTRYGYEKDGRMSLRNWFLTPARYEGDGFIKYSNNNLDDIANATSDFDLTVKLPTGFELVTDLNARNTADGVFTTYYLSGRNRIDFNLFVGSNSDFHSYRKDGLEILSDLKDSKLDEVRKALLVGQIMDFVKENVGEYPHEKLTLSQADYERNPFYGLNQLPSFISPFSDDFLFEIKFLKTYLNNYLKTSIQLDSRKDNWIYDAIQVYTMMKYIDEVHPNSKMMGSVSKVKLLKNYNLTNLDFNGQYSYFYMLMARKNLDQPIGDPKNTLIKFNEQIAGKYRAGLSIKYLDGYLDNDAVEKSLKQFYQLSKSRQSNRADFEGILKANSNKNIDWFFTTIIDSRAIVDYKFSSFSKTRDSITFTIKNKTGTAVPIPVYGIKDKQVVFKKWYENITTDSTFTVNREEANKIVINYKNEVPEFNLRNNWKSLKNFSPSNRPFKFTLLKDLEDPYYNQILYIPTAVYNLYDGISPGIRFSNKTILDKPFIFDINPAYSPNTQSMVGSFSFGLNDYDRDSNWFNTRYFLTGQYFHYAPDAAYLKITPSILFKIREPNFRDNRKEAIQVRQVILNLEPTQFEDVSFNDTNDNYSVFNVKYFNTKTEITNHFNFVADLQLAGKFGKSSVEFGYRKLFEDNRQVNIRLFAGAFIYNKTNSDYFSFALDRPTDYLFDYNYYGRSESTGFFSQQLIQAEGGFKSKLINPYANQWITTVNASFNVWNWIEIYGDAGFIKNKGQNERFVYDNGVRLNLVTDYFELYLPVYSNNGWEISQPNYQEKIRFVITFSPSALVNLFTRKWF